MASKIVQILASLWMTLCFIVHIFTGDPSITIFVGYFEAFCDYSVLFLAASNNVNVPCGLIPKRLH